ncbi:MAG: hypothetical protein GDA36_03535 [Rhodobacteraceae bacterium]|nr:hypothetical protein [Paracoccaceae bacterium]
MAELLNGPETDTVDSTRNGKPLRGKILNPRRDSQDIWAETNLVAILGLAGEVEMTVAIEHDVTLARNHAKENRYRRPDRRRGGQG